MKKWYLQYKFTDYVLIRVESRLNSRIGSFHLALNSKILQDNYTPDDEMSDKPFNEEINVRTSGIVVAVPHNLTPVTLYENYLGTPRYSHHITHEVIKDAIRRMPKKLRGNYGRNMYNPGNPSESFQHQPNNPEIEVGDKIYFEYNVLIDSAAYVDEDEDGIVYKVPYQSIYCYVREDKITMVNGWVFVESIRREQLSKYILFVNDKPKPNIGKIAHISKWLDKSCAGQGDTALFIRTLFSVKEYELMTDSHSVSGYEVEGKHYYPLRNWEIVATLNQSTFQWVTTDDYMQIKPEKVDTIGVLKPIEFKNGEVQSFQKGQIFVPEGTITHEKTNRVNKFGIGIDVKSGHKIAYGKTSLYLYLNEFDLLFVHRNDVWGTFTYADYVILDKDGYEMPSHWSGRKRTKDEADRLVKRLNINGENAPYKTTNKLKS